MYRNIGMGLCVLVILGCSSGGKTEKTEPKITPHSEELGFLKAFKEASEIMFQSDGQRKDLYKCAFGKEYEGKDPNPVLKTCISGCFSYEGGSAEFWDCHGKCWKSVGGQETAQGRADCFKLYLAKLKTQIEKAESRSKELTGCSQEAFTAFAKAATRALSIKPHPPIVNFPIQSNPRDTTLTAMSTCTQRYFECQNETAKSPCKALDLAQAIGADPNTPGGSTKIFIKGGQEIDWKTLQLKKQPLSK